MTDIDLNEVNWDVYDLVDKKLVFKSYGKYETKRVDGKPGTNQLVFTKMSEPDTRDCISAKCAW